MSLAWVDWSNPVAIWWVCLVIVGTGNIAALGWLGLRYHRGPRRTGTALSIEPLLLLCAVYVLVCAFRSAMPRADVQRICLFDTWLSSVMVGRSVATVAELCFAAQWAIVLRTLSRLANSDTAQRHLPDHRAADRGRGMLLVVCGDHDELSGQCRRELDLDADFRPCCNRADPAGAALSRRRFNWSSPEPQSAASVT